MRRDWDSSVGNYPHPPPNVQVMSPMFTGALDLRWDDPAILNTGKSSGASAAATGTIRVRSAPKEGAQVVFTHGTYPSTGEYATGTVTVSSAPIAPGAVLRIGTVDLTALAGAPVAGQDAFDGSSLDATVVAANVAAAINSGSLGGWGSVTATASGAVVTITAAELGSAGNEIRLYTSTNSLSLSGYALSGGVDPGEEVEQEYALTATYAARTSGSNNFTVGVTDFETASSIAAAINDTANHFRWVVTASASGGTVTLTAVPGGAQGNSINMASDTSALAVSGSTLAGGYGPAGAEGRNNTGWSIIGVNVYRSDSGERGPYRRLNAIPVGGQFFRDYTDTVRIENEIVDWDSGWVSKGDTANDRRWTLRTKKCPISKSAGQAIHADAPADVRVTIDGVTVPVETVFGPTGEITLVNKPTYDLAGETMVDPILPNSDGSSVVLVTYCYNRNLVKTDLESKAKIFYRLTTVALDASTPSGLTETPLGWSPPVSIHEVEKLDYIWKEAVRRNTWILQQGGERVKLFIQRVTGVACPCRVYERYGEVMAQPFDQGKINSNCPTCYGTGFVSGYEGPIDLILAPDDAERRVAQTPIGRRLEHTYEVWTGPSPMLSQRDFVVKQTGERYSIGPVRRPAVRGLPLQQHFNIAYIDEKDIRYQVPVSGITELDWPETRTTDQRTAVNDADPHPVGFDYQATTMGTEKDNIPDEREQRGRTPVWSNIEY